MSVCRMGRGEGEGGGPRLVHIRLNRGPAGPCWVGVSLTLNYFDRFHDHHHLIRGDSRTVCRPVDRRSMGYPRTVLWYWYLISLVSYGDLRYQYSLLYLLLHSFVSFFISLSSSSHIEASIQKDGVAEKPQLSFVWQSSMRLYSLSAHKELNKLNFGSSLRVPPLRLP